MTDWIFSGNRDSFDIDNYLKNFDYIYWAVKHLKHQNEMQIGDRVFIWRSKGKSKDPYGLVGFGKIIEAPVSKHNVAYPQFLGEKFWKVEEVSGIKVGIRLASVRLDLESGLVESSLLRQDSELAKMQLLTAQQGTNFKLTSEQSQKIWNLWSGHSLDFDDEEYETDESKLRTRIHKSRERDPVLVRKAKEQFIKTNGCLFCESCGFNFKKLYGFSYAEAHHKKPLNQIEDGEKTKLSDIAILCANCHRAVHRINADDPWTELLKLHNKL